MSERPATIYVTHELRAKIKSLKKELTYDEFLTNLIKKIVLDLPQSRTYAKRKTTDSAKSRSSDSQ